MPQDRGWAGSTGGERSYCIFPTVLLVDWIFFVIATGNTISWENFKKVLWKLHGWKKIWFLQLWELVYHPALNKDYIRNLTQLSSAFVLFIICRIALYECYERALHWGVFSVNEPLAWVNRIWTEFEASTRRHWRISHPSSLSLLDTPSPNVQKFYVHAFYQKTLPLLNFHVTLQSVGLTK